MSYPSLSHIEPECQESFIQGKIHIQQNSKEGRLFIKLGFRESCDSKRSGLHLFDNMTIIHWVKNRSKAER